MPVPKYIAKQQALSHAHSKIMKISLIIFPCILTLWILTIHFTHRPTRIPIDQLRAIADGNMNEAYQLTTKHFQQRYSFANFTSLIDQHPDLKDNKGIVFQPGKNGYLSGFIKTADNHKIMVEYQMKKEAGVWRIEDMQVMDRLS